MPKFDRERKESIILNLSSAGKEVEDMFFHNKVRFYQKRYYVKHFAFNVFWEMVKLAKNRRAECRTNRQRAFWALSQGVSEAMFLLFV